jgi:predicted nuclease with TOPRIM domain
MEASELLTRKHAVEDKFNELEQRKSELSGEMYRLQGEYRLINELLDNLNKKEEDGSEPGRTQEPVGQP